MSGTAPVNNFSTYCTPKLILYTTQNTLAKGVHSLNRSLNNSITTHTFLTISPLTKHFNVKCRIIKAYGLYYTPFRCDNPCNNTSCYV